MIIRIKVKNIKPNDIIYKNTNTYVGNTFSDTIRTFFGLSIENKEAYEFMEIENVNYVLSPIIRIQSTDSYKYICYQEDEYVWKYYKLLSCINLHYKTS